MVFNLEPILWGDYNRKDEIKKLANDGAIRIWDTHTHDLESVKEHKENGKIEGFLSQQEVADIRAGKRDPIPTGPSPTDIILSTEGGSPDNVEIIHQVVEPAGIWQFQPTAAYRKMQFQDQLKAVSKGNHLRKEMINAYKENSPEAEVYLKEYITHHKAAGIDMEFKPSISSMPVSEGT